MYTSNESEAATMSKYIVSCEYNNSSIVYYGDKAKAIQAAIYMTGLTGHEWTMKAA